MIIIAAALLAPVTWAKSAEYEGGRGYLVYSVRKVRIGMHFDFSYRRIAALDGKSVQDWNGTF